MGVRVKSEAYSNWVHTSSARRLLSLEAGWLREAISDLHGHHIAYVGIDDTPRFLRRARSPHVFSMAPQWQSVSPCDARIQDDQWPLPDKSIDVLVIQHGLDMSFKPHQVLREAARVLVPSGYILVVGFSPLSWFGMVRKALFFSAEMPWVVNPVSQVRLQDWLTLLDFRVESVSAVAHLWPLQLGAEAVSRRIDRKLAGNPWLPSNAYMLTARKTVAGMTPVGSKFWNWSASGLGISPAPSPATYAPAGPAASASGKLDFSIKSHHQALGIPVALDTIKSS